MGCVPVQKIIDDFDGNQIILDAMLKTDDHLSNYNTVVASISGGSDSDIVLDMLEYLRPYHPDTEIHYVWFDTGMEYEATKRHLDYLENHYGIEIERIRAKVPVPLACQKVGIPFLSKEVSQHIYELQKHDFNFADKPFDELYAVYSKCKNGLEWWCDVPTKRPFTISRNKWLKEFMVQNPPDFKISRKCCDYAKKAPARERERERERLEILGIRRSEGGVRAHLKSCFSCASKSRNIDLYRPIFWFSDKDKNEYEIARNIVHSECYTKYGFKRTGCAACPFGRDFEDTLKALETYEPKLYRAAIGVFQKSYEYTRKYREFYKMMEEKERKRKEIESGQMSMFD